jgi:hypothetical protein
MNFLEKSDYDWLDLLNFFERPFRAKLIPSKVWKDLDRYRNDSVGLVNYCKKWRTKVEFRKERSKAKFYETHIAIGGEYDPEERQCVVQIHTDYYDKFKFTDSSWKKFKFKFIQVLMHEMIHFMQYDRRMDEYSNYVVPYKKIGHARKDAERRYLSEFDEIQAYAHCIFLDYKVLKPNIPVDTLLSRFKTKKDSKTFNYILRVFNNDHRNNHAIQKIIQQIGKWDRKYERVARANRRPK